ncbi:mitochondrial 54S ribosomal protein bL28m [Thermothelomyces heterothallicus CBS 202.75]|uniref:mitochondrial 54S ribosomal protein bL28m n=1 Tax=Thermothelomyces heterothallicus CBS 202.75 TaxID=1149848 RepID=UPI00374410CB
MPPSLPLQTCLRAGSRPTTSLSSFLKTTVTTTTTVATTTRTLVTTAPSHYKQSRVPGSDIPIPSASGTHPEIPPYPHGPRLFYHQSNTGLYGSARIRFGNHVSEKFEVKARRKWRPNVHQKRLWSASLGVFVRTRVTTRVLRTIDKVGGLDEYLLGIKPQRVKDLGPWGWKLRWRIMQTPAVRARFAAEREALGLPPKEEEELRKEANRPLPDGTAAGDALMAETNQMLADEAEFELGSEASEASEGAQDGFMREEKPRQ